MPWWRSSGASSTRSRPETSEIGGRTEFPGQAEPTLNERTQDVAKILLVEDDEMNRDMLSRRLIKRGYEVVIATDGQQGVDLARSENPALILMDMSLPVMDGWTATRALKDDPSTSGIPIIALTAHAMSGDENKAREAGCDEFDTKPVELKRLLSKMEGLLE